MCNLNNTINEYTKIQFINFKRKQKHTNECNNVNVHKRNVRCCLRINSPHCCNTVGNVDVISKRNGDRTIVVNAYKTNIVKTTIITQTLTVIKRVVSFFNRSHNTAKHVCISFGITSPNVEINCAVHAIDFSFTS
jgi:hypothetical protein